MNHALDKKGASAWQRGNYLICTRRWWEPVISDCGPQGRLGDSLPLKIYISLKPIRLSYPPRIPIASSLRSLGDFRYYNIKKYFGQGFFFIPIAYTPSKWPRDSLVERKRLPLFTENPQLFGTFPHFHHCLRRSNPRLEAFPVPVATLLEGRKCVQSVQPSKGRGVAFGPRRLHNTPLDPDFLEARFR